MFERGNEVSATTTWHGSGTNRTHARVVPSAERSPVVSGCRASLKLERHIPRGVLSAGSNDQPEPAVDGVAVEQIVVALVPPSRLEVSVEPFETRRHIRGFEEPEGRDATPDGRIQ